jgi:1D-myo-inositol-triphosphate 3-kinase
LKKVKSREEVMVTMALFLGGREDTRQRLLARLKEIREKFEQSSYFQSHEVVGSSIFMIYDDTKVGAWIIDFAKTLPVPEGQVVSHREPWVQGNHEEGFLTGLDSLISVSIPQQCVWDLLSCSACTRYLETSFVYKASSVCAVW